LLDSESANHRVKTIVGTDRWAVNTYFISSKESGNGFLVDSGGDSVELLSALSYFPGNIEFVLLTHGHFDHLSSASEICDVYGIPCIVHSNDAKLVRHAPFYAVSFDGSSIRVPKHLLSMELTGTVYCSDWDVTVMETPGHTAGSQCFILDKFVFTGDTLIKEAIGRTDQPGGNQEAILDSVGRILDKAPEDGIILPGHGCPWTVMEARSWWAHCHARPPQHRFFLNSEQT
jgi:glyoxylase-like metal-dependent hydrolase (beta-lactamase superfamily II)